MELQSILFWFFSALGIAGGIGLLLNSNPVHAALSLIVNFFSIAGLYLTLQAEFLSVIQILVYAGAIMVLFLFVIMLLNLGKEPMGSPFSFAKIAAFILGAAFFMEMWYILGDAFGLKEGAEAAEVAFLDGNFAMASVESVGLLMMTKFVFPFEMISVVLIASLVGAIVVAKKYRYENENETPVKEN